MKANASDSPREQPEPAGAEILKEAHALAFLAAQPRFARLSDKDALHTASDFLEKAQELVEWKRRLADLKHRDYVAPLEKIREPKAWPATFEDFLKRVVGGKDQGEQLQRFRGFLRRMIEGAPSYHLPKKVCRILKAIDKARQVLDNPKAKPAAIEKAKQLLSDGAKTGEVEEAKIDAVEKLLKEYQQTSFSRFLWRENAQSFLRYWAGHKHAAKSSAGAKGAAKKKRQAAAQKTS